MKHTLIERLKVQALLTAPFFATFLFRIPLLEDTTCKTAYTNGKAIGFNPGFMNSLPLKQQLTILFHEILHISNLHHVRMGGRELTRWNYATDYAINLLLKDNGFPLPEGALLDEQYRGMHAEQIYNLLPECCSQNFVGLSVCSSSGTTIISAGSGLTPLEIGEIRPGDFVTPQEREAHINELKGLLAEATQVAKVRGVLPLGVERLIDTMHQATVNWKEALASFLSEQFRSDYTFTRPNRRYLSAGIYLPSIQSTQRGNFILAVDTSGSVSTKRLQELSSEIMSILSLSREKLDVLYFDAKVALHQELFEGELENLTPKGGGGTDFAPVVDYISANLENPHVLIYFTDGCCDSFASEPEYPVLWVCESLGFKPPYGEVIYLPHAA